MRKLIDNVERKSFRLKDLLTVIQHKHTEIRVYLNNCKIDYDLINTYEDSWVIDISPDVITTMSGDMPCIIITVGENFD